MPNISEQLTAIRTATRALYGEHPTAGRGGRTDILQPAITPDSAQRLVDMLRPSIRSIVERDEYDMIHGRLLEGETPSEVKDSPGFFRLKSVTWNNKVGAVSGVFMAETAIQQARSLFSSGSQVFRGRTVLGEAPTQLFWGGLEIATRDARSISAQVTFGEKMEAAVDGARDGFETVGGAVAKTIEVAGTAVGAVGGAAVGGLLAGLGPLGIIAIAAAIYVALES